MKIFATCLLVLASCSGLRAAEKEATHLAGRENKEPGMPGYQQIADDDKQFDRAAEQAQRSLGFFMAALRAKKTGDTSFGIKKGFVEGDKVEHLWLSDVTYDGKNFHGKIDNRPHDLKNVHLGQRMTVRPQDVDDWMFVKDGNLMGGYTTRILYARLSPEERAQFDQQAEFKIQKGNARK